MGLSKLNTDSKLENEGVWVLVHSDTDENGKDYDVRIRVRRAGGTNKKYERAKAAAFRPHQRQMRAGMLADEQVERLMQGVYSLHVVCAWENVDINDEMVECTPENVLAVFKAYPFIWEAVFETSQSMDVYREELEEAAGNS